MATTINGSTGASQIQDNTVSNAKVADDAIGVAELSATGTASSSTFLRGDNAWAAPGGGGLTQLASAVTTTGTSVEIDSLDLSTYKQLIIESWSVSHSTAGYTPLRWSNTGGTFQNTSINGTTNTEGSYGRMYHDLVNKYVWVNTLDRNYAGIDQTFYMGNGEVKVGVNNQVTTATTSLTFDWASGATFDAGQIILYGLK
jgi:hypothetical protein